MNSDKISIISHINESQKDSQNLILSNNFINPNIQRVQNTENNELSLFSNINYLNNLTFKDEKIEADINEKNEN